eukprot:scaffold209569_cov23-Tisochrysis_lutea.AAC.1
MGANHTLSLSALLRALPLASLFFLHQAAALLYVLLGLGGSSSSARPAALAVSRAALNERMTDRQQENSLSQ